MSELFVVATPIGNLGDITPRMTRALSECDLIAAEDTRVTMKLLNHLGIKKPLVSCHRHNEPGVAEGLVSRMLFEDIKLCVTCDAGTPGISDPGSDLVRLSIASGIRVTPICGPTAITAHLSCSGFGGGEFAFYGFLPREKKALREKLDKIRRAGISVNVFYESPHRVVDLMKAICEAYPGCMASVACDISKLYEKIETAPCEVVLERLRNNANVEKGEYCVAVDLSSLPPVEAPAVKTSCECAILEAMLSGLDVDEASKKAGELGYARNELYKARLKIKEFLSE